MKKDFMLEPIVYKFDFEFYIFFEVPVEELRKELPHWIQAIEIRPGVGLLAVGGIRFLPGNLDGKLPVFYEPNVSIVIQPNLGTNMPIPRVSLYTFNVTSDNIDFLEHCKHVDKMPIYYPSNMRISADDASFTYECSDDKGPILSFQTSNKNQFFEDLIFYVQVLREFEGNFYFSCVKWEGAVSEVQLPENSNYRLYNHPLFKNINVGTLSGNCYIEMIGKPGKIQTFYKPVLIR